MFSRNARTRRHASASVLAFVLTLVALPAAPTRVEAGYGRMPYYSAWGSKGSYMYRHYNYYAPAYGGYRKHIAVYYPSQPRYVYYYNPYKRRYWGRYDLMSGGYSTLAVADRRENLADIAEDAFPAPGAMPTPEDGEDALLPPVENLPPSRPSPTPAPTAVLRPMLTPVRGGGSNCHGY